MTPARLLVVLACASCGGSPRTEPAISSRVATPQSVDPSEITNRDRCAMVEAAFSVEEFRKFACGENATEGGRFLVDVVTRRQFAADETCDSRVFAIYRKGQRTNTDAVVRLGIGSDDGGVTWSFGASFFDPPNSPDDRRYENGFDDANYYCGYIGGRLERTAGGWRGWHEKWRGSTR